MLRVLTLATLLGVAAGCGESSPGKRPATEAEPAGDAEKAASVGKTLLLKEEPPGALGVKETRAAAKNGDTVVIVGRVGGHEKPFTPGRARFLVVGMNLKPAMECDCPWDFCESPKKELEASRANVKFVDADGKTLEVDARQAFGIKELSTVVVKGHASRDDAGNLTVVGTGLFVKEK